MTTNIPTPEQIGNARASLDEATWELEMELDELELIQERIAGFREEIRMANKIINAGV